MREFVDRWLVQLVVGLAVLAVGAVALALVSLVAAESARDDATLARAELASSSAEIEGLRTSVADFLSEARALQTQLVDAGPPISGALKDALAGLETFATSTIELNVPIRQNLAIESTIELDQTLRVPLRTTVPIDETIETTITVDTPVGVGIPIDVRVPLQLELPIELTLSVPLQETIPVDLDVPVSLDVPVKRDVASTELGTLADSLTSGLSSLETLLSSIEG